MKHTRLADELGRAELGDKRLSDRLEKMIDTLQASPSQSLPKAFTESELEAAYRFFSNEKVDAQAILQPHYEATAERARACTQDVLALHDTSVMGFSGDMIRRGLAKTRGKASKQGFLAHVTLAVERGNARRPLGTLGLTTVVRSQRKVAGDVRESARWYRHVEAADRLVADRRKLVHVMDRESDDYALFSRMHMDGHRFVIRLAHNRVLDTQHGSERKLLDEIQKASCVVQREIPVSTRKTAASAPRLRKIHPAREARVAKLAIGAVEVTIRRPRLQAKTRRGPASTTVLPDSVTLHVVHVWELDPPNLETAVRWILLTNEPIHDADALARIVDAYRCRWAIEDLFKALKTGCAYEQRQLESFHALENCLAVLLPIAYQLLLIRGQAHSAGDELAATVMNPIQLQVLQTFARKPLPKQPTVRDVFLAIAALGGHLKRNGEPGWLTLMRGYAELSLLSRAWAAARNATCDRKDVINL
jgi:hypothetical protein